MTFPTSLTARPGEGRDLIQFVSPVRREIPAFAGMSGKRTRPSLAAHEQGEGAAASGDSQTIAASTIQKTP